MFQLNYRIRISRASPPLDCVDNKAATDEIHRAEGGEGWGPTQERWNERSGQWKSFGQFVEISANQRGIDYNLRLKENHFCKSHLRVTSLPPSLPLFTSCRMTSNKVDYRFVLILCTGDYLFSCNGTHPLFSLLFWLLANKMFFCFRTFHLHLRRRRRFERVNNIVCHYRHVSASPAKFL